MELEIVAEVNVNSRDRHCRSTGVLRPTGVSIDVTSSTAQEPCQVKCQSVLKVDVFFLCLHSALGCYFWLQSVSDRAQMSQITNLEFFQIRFQYILGHRAKIMHILKSDLSEKLGFVPY